MNINHLFIFPNINPYLDGLQLGQVAILHLIFRGSDQVVPVPVLHDSMTREQVDGVPGARVEEAAPAQQAAHVDLIKG